MFFEITRDGRCRGVVVLESGVWSREGWAFLQGMAGLRNYLLGDDVFGLVLFLERF